MLVELMKDPEMETPVVEESLRGKAWVLRELQKLVGAGEEGVDVFDQVIKELEAAEEEGEVAVLSPEDVVSMPEGLALLWSRESRLEGRPCTLFEALMVLMMKEGWSMPEVRKHVEEVLSEASEGIMSRMEVYKRDTIKLPAKITSLGRNATLKKIKLCNVPYYEVTDSEGRTSLFSLAEWKEQASDGKEGLSELMSRLELSESSVWRGGDDGESERMIVLGISSYTGDLEVAIRLQDWDNEWYLGDRVLVAPPEYVRVNDSSKSAVVSLAPWGLTLEGELRGKTRSGALVISSIFFGAKALHLSGGHAMVCGRRTIHPGLIIYGNGLNVKVSRS